MAGASQISLLKAWETRVRVICCEYSYENVCAYVRETLGVLDVFHSSSVLTSGQTAGLIWTNTHRQSTLFQVLLLSDFLTLFLSFLLTLDLFVSHVHDMVHLYLSIFHCV